MRIAGLRGRNLELVEHRVLRYLAEHGIRPDNSPRDREAARKGTRRPLAEDLAMRLG